MQQAKIVLHTGFQIARVDPRLFGGFLEHLGRAVYGGVYDPASLYADALGCRRDVLAEIVAGNDPKAANSFANPELVAAREFSEHSVVGGALQCRLPPLSFTAMALKLE